MSITDLHTHILPGIDDGSKNAEETRKLLLRQRELGITVIGMTPHFYAERESLRDFLAARAYSVQHMEKIAEDQLPAYCIGAEVHYFSHISTAKSLDQLCFEESNILLLEMPFCQWTDEIYRELVKMVVQQKRTVILAHLERYWSFQKDKKVLQAVMDLPVLGQCNAASLLEWRKRHQVLLWMKKKRVHLLGSDCHNLTDRSPNLMEGRRIVEQKLGTAQLEKLDQVGDQLLQQMVVHQIRAVNR